MVYTEKMKKFIQETQYGINRKELTRRFNEKFNTTLSDSAIKAFCLKHGLVNGIKKAFSKGCVPSNKGKKVSNETYEKMKKTMFKAGHVPFNFREIGSERINKDGYIEIKVEGQKEWPLKHKYIFEKAHGKVPKGHCIFFLDQNRLNCELSNLKLIPRSTLAILNKSNKLTKDADLNIALINISKAILIINKKRRKGKNGK